MLTSPLAWSSESPDEIKTFPPLSDLEFPPNKLRAPPCESNDDPAVTVLFPPCCSVEFPADEKNCPPGARFEVPAFVNNDPVCFSLDFPTLMLISPEEISASPDEILTPLLFPNVALPVLISIDPVSPPPKECSV